MDNDFHFDILFNYESWNFLCNYVVNVWVIPCFGDCNLAFVFALDFT